MSGARTAGSTPPQPTPPPPTPPPVPGDDDLAALYEEAPCGCMSVGRDGVIVRVNRTLLDWTGYARDALLGGTKRFTDLLTVPGRIFYSTQLAPMLQMQGFARELAFDLVCPAGRPSLPVLLNATAVRDAGGRTAVTRITFFDATQRRRYERDLLQAGRNADRLTAVIACSGDAVCTLDVNGRVDSWNAAAERLFGTPAVAAVGRPVGTAMGIDRPGPLDTAIGRAPSRSAAETIEFQLPRPGGRDLCLAVAVAAVRDAMDRVAGLTLVARDVTDRREAEERLLHASLYDRLTGLPNRVLFADRVARCVDRAARDPAFAFAVLSIDLDRFQAVNDSLGHAAGDQVLVAVAAELNACATTSAHPDALRPATGQPVVAHLGGDEFAILHEGIRAPEDAVYIAEQLGTALNRTRPVDGRDVYISASIGVAFAAPAVYASADDVLRDADAALHRAKENGRATHAIFDAAMRESAVARLGLENDLRRAVERDELLLYYQPLVGLADGHLHGFEALVRWRRDGRLVSPGQFIPVAEETGLIRPIGLWVLDRACRQLADWRARHPRAAGLTMAINVSRKQLADPLLVPALGRAIADHGIPPGSLKVEITESVVMEAGAGSPMAVLTAIKETGVVLAIDDFGTGYSSLSCLHTFPIDVLKLDQSFVADVTDSRGAAAVVAGVVSLAHALGLTVVAEGLERPEQVAFLQQLGCDLGQGYTFAKPLPTDEAEQWVESGYALRGWTSAGGRTGRGARAA